MRNGQIFAADGIQHQIHTDLRHFFDRRSQSGQPFWQKIPGPSVVIANDRDILRDSEPGFGNSPHGADCNVIIAGQICAGLPGKREKVFHPFIAGGLKTHGRVGKGGMFLRMQPAPGQCLSEKIFPQCLFDDIVAQITDGCMPLM